MKVRECCLAEPSCYILHSQVHTALKCTYVRIHGNLRASTCFNQWNLQCMHVKFIMADLWRSTEQLFKIWGKSTKVWSFSTKSHRIYINASFQISKAQNFIQHHNSRGRRCETFLTNVHGLNFFNPNCLNTHSGIFNKWRSAVTWLHLNFWDYEPWTVYRKDPFWVLNSGIYIINKFICKLQYFFVSKI